MSRRAKTFAFLTLTFGLVVLGMAVVASKDQIFEKWYVQQLETGDLEAKERALDALPKVCSEEGLIKVTENDLREWPDWMYRWGLPGYVNPIGLDWPEVERMRPPYGKVVCEICERIGKPWAGTPLFRYMSDSKADERTRVHLAQFVILVTARRENLTEFFKKPGSLNAFPSGTQSLNDFMAVKPTAIGVLIQALSSKDKFCRDGAVFTLSLCGPEAAAAVSALKAILKDSDEFVCKYATEALGRIQGN